MSRWTCSAWTAWVNGHEWAKRQAVRADIGFTELPSRLRVLR